MMSLLTKYYFLKKTSGDTGLLAFITNNTCYSHAFSSSYCKYSKFEDILNEMVVIVKTDAPSILSIQRRI